MRGTLRSRIKEYTGALPDFIIVGAQKCGTTSLYHYLVQHPCIYPASVKEVGYFDRYYAKGIGWYRAQFPSRLKKLLATHLRGEPFLTGEASTGYIMKPHSLRRIQRTLPGVKVLLMLRNPVDRAYSHYQHTLRIRRETLPFEEAIGREEERIGSAWKRMLEEDDYYNLEIAFYGYLRTGMYADQVRVLQTLFPKERTLIMRTEDFNADPASAVRRVVAFLGLPAWAPERFERHNKGSYETKLEPRVRERLVEYFRPHNERLSSYLGIGLGWDR